jgi:membrane-bound ClpP family serine protease
MWVVAGLLFGLVVLVSLAGFHVGPHAHVAAGVLGIVTAAWFITMAVDGHDVPLLWILLGADLALSVGVSALAVTGRHAASHAVAGLGVGSPEGALGVAVGNLSPSGIVRVGGETWSAVAVNGTVPDGSPIHVLGVDGVRLSVWGEEAVAPPDDAAPSDPFAPLTPFTPLTPFAPLTPLTPLTDEKRHP